jgi:hypothetical protein
VASRATLHPPITQSRLPEAARPESTEHASPKLHCSVHGTARRGRQSKKAIKPAARARTRSRRRWRLRQRRRSGGGMGVLRSTQSLEAEVEEMRGALLLHGAWAWRPGGGAAKRAARAVEPAAAEARTVCVTGGTSFLGFAVVDRLLRHGYTVRLALETQGTSVSPSLPYFTTAPSTGCTVALLWHCESGAFHVAVGRLRGWLSEGCFR